MIRSGDGSQISGDYIIPLSGCAARSYRVVECLLPNTCYPITTGSNDVLIWMDGSVPRQCSIPQGYHTYDTLPNALTTAMNTVSGSSNTLTVTKLDLTGQLSFSATKPFTLNFWDDPNKVTPATTLGRILGFENYNYAATGSGPYTLTAPYPINLAWNMAFYVTIRDSSTQVRYSDSTCSFVVPITVSENNMTVYRPVRECRFRLEEDVEKLRLNITDDSNKSVNFQGSNFYIMLEEI